MPIDAKYEIRNVFDLGEKNTIMNDSRNVTLNNSFGSKEQSQILNCCRRDNRLLTFDVKGEDEHWRKEYENGDTHFITNRSILESQPPKSIVCYKEVNYHIVKGEYINEVTPLEENNSIENLESSHCKGTTKGGVEMEFDGLIDSKERRDVKLLSKDESFVDSTLPIPEFGTRSFLRSLLNSLDVEEKKGVQTHDKIHSSNNTVLDSPMASEPKEQVLDTNEKITENVKQQNISENKDENSDNISQEQSSLVIQNVNLDEFSSISQYKSVNFKERSQENNVIQYNGELSFSRASFVSHSGAVPSFGDVSLRSDLSATSARSFAFPELQSEWNRSPARMGNAEKKHKGWRSSILCCGF